MNFAELPPALGEEATDGGLPPRLQKLVERVTLELYCQYELSLAFREPVPPENLHYHSKVPDQDLPVRDDRGAGLIPAVGQLFA